MAAAVVVAGRHDLHRSSCGLKISSSATLPQAAGSPLATQDRRYLPSPLPPPTNPHAAPTYHAAGAWGRPQATWLEPRRARDGPTANGGGGGRGGGSDGEPPRGGRGHGRHPLPRRPDRGAPPRDNVADGAPSPSRQQHAAARPTAAARPSAARGGAPNGKRVAQPPGQTAKGRQAKIHEIYAAKNTTAPPRARTQGGRAADAADGVESVPSATAASPPPRWRRRRHHCPPPRPPPLTRAQRGRGCRGPMFG